MKEKKTRKTFVLFALVLTFMLGLVGTSLFAFAESSGAENTVIAADMFDKSLARKTLESYDTTYSQIQNQGHYIYKGIELPFDDASKPSSYTLAGTFSGDSEIEYAFSSSGAIANTKFVYKDKSGNELFTIERYFEYGGTYRYVAGAKMTIGGTEVLSTKDTWDEGKIIPWAYLTDDWGKANIAGKDDLQEDAISQRAGYIKIDVESAAVNVGFPAKKDSHTYGTDDVTEKIYVLDGSKASNISDIVNGLNDGYTVSMERTVATQQNVLIISINGIKLDGTTVATTDVTPADIRVAYPTEFIENEKKYIDSIQGEDLQTFAAQKLVSLNCTTTGAAWKNYVDTEAIAVTGFDKNKVGLQKITVSGNEYNVFVAPKVTGFDLLDGNDYKYTTLESYDSTWSGLAGQGHYINKGIEFPFDDATKPDSYYLPGTFVGGFDTEYAFSSRGNGSNDGMKFVFENLSGEELFTVERYHVWGEVRQGGSVKVTKGGTELFKEEAMIYPSKYLTDDYQADKPDGCVQDAVAQRPGNIRVDVSDSSVTVSVTKIVNYNDFAVLGAEGSQSFTINVDKASDIATIISAMNTGYKVKVERGAAGRQNVLIIGINGKKLTDQAVTYRALSTDKFEYDGDKNGSGDTLYIARRGTLEPVTVTGKVAVAGVSATGEWKLPYSAKGTVKATDGSVVSTDTAGNQTVNMTAVFFAREFVQSVTLVVEESQKLVYQTNYGTNGGTALDDLYFSQNDPIGDLATPSRTGGWTFEGWFASSDLSGNALTTAPAYSAEGGTSNDTVTLYAKWGDYEKPVVALKSGVNSLTVSVKADGGSVSFSKADVTAEDRAWGVISADGITVEIKAPNASDFVDISAFVFDDALYGNYTVKYTATDGSNNGSEPVERIIRYVPQLPSITLSGDRISDGYVNHRIDLPAGTSSSAVTVSVVAGGKAVNVVDNGFTPTQSGTYTVAYYTKDEYGSETVETFDIEIKADGEKPVIIVDFDIETGTVGAEISLPSATATDNADGSVSVSVSVTFGDKEITVENGKFTPSEAGIYTVTYTATDASGNTAIVSREILVSAASGGKKGSGCKNATVGDFGIGAIVLIAASLTLLIAKRKIV